MLAGLFAIIAAAAFTGAAFYINVAEHPARRALPTGAALAQWRPAYRRGFAMQASLAVVGGGCAIWQWNAAGGVGWLAGGLLLLANWPYTLAVIMPTNNRLMAAGADADPASAALLERWNRLHMARTGLGALAIFAMLVTAAG